MSWRPAFGSERMIQLGITRGGLMAHRASFFYETLIVSAEGYKEEYRSDILEAMDPLSPLAFLAT